MPRRRQFQGIAAGLIGMFAGRNNDMDGYWALGKLYARARIFNVSEVCVDLLNLVATPPGEDLSRLAESLQQWIFDQCEAQGLSREWLCAAEISVNFTGKQVPKLPGDTFECLATLKDDLGKVYQAGETGACWPHDPGIESKSTRAS